MAGNKPDLDRKPPAPGRLPVGLTFCGFPLRPQEFVHRGERVFLLTLDKGDIAAAGRAQRDTEQRATAWKV